MKLDNILCNDLSHFSYILYGSEKCIYFIIGIFSLQHPEYLMLVLLNTLWKIY